MPNEKIENLLNLALDATEEEREKSIELDVGYDRTENTWEVIVKFGGTTEELDVILRENFGEQYARIRMTNLQNEYAILTLPESLIEAVALLPEIEYMEKPKLLFFAVNNGKRASCITPLQTAGAFAAGGGEAGNAAVTGGGGAGNAAGTGCSQLGVPDRSRNRLSGAGVLVAVIDSGIDYAHPDFRNADGTTRILALWDQTIPSGSVAAPEFGEKAESAPGQAETAVPGTEAEGAPVQEEISEREETSGQEGAPDREAPAAGYLYAPAGYYLGTEFSQEIINRALEQPTEQQRYAVCPSRDSSGHGTHVAGIAAGNGRASQGRYRGVAYAGSMVIVKLGTPGEGAFPRTTELMQAVDYCVRKAEEYGMPLALNLSFGNNYGSHSGTSLIETYLDDMANYWRSSIVIGSGNEGASAAHTAGRMQAGRTENVQLSVSPYERALNLQIWKSYADEISVSLVHPNGTVVGPIRQIQGTQRFTVGTTEILLYYGEPSPYSPYQEIYFELLPAGDYVDAGIWEIRLVPQKIVTGNYDMWLPAGGVLNEGTGFLYPSEETTLTIPSTAGRVITVGAYDARFNQLASFSGRGYTRETNQVKPDIAAPGVEITSCAPGGGYTARTGTSMATPFVTGSAALLMEWGIVNGNDRYLYGEKMKAYFIRGARRLPVLREYPNPQLGWGVLCTADSIPE